MELPAPKLVSEWTDEKVLKIIIKDLEEKSDPEAIIVIGSSTGTIGALIKPLKEGGVKGNKQLIKDYRKAYEEFVESKPDDQNPTGIKERVLLIIKRLLTKPR